MKSSFLSLGKQDLIKGLLLAVISAFITALLQQIQEGNVLPTIAQLKADGVVAASAGLGYVLKNLRSLIRAINLPSRLEPKPVEPDVTGAKM
jgi:hypothetical protein